MDDAPIPLDAPAPAPTPNAASAPAPHATPCEPTIVGAVGAVGAAGASDASNTPDVLDATIVSAPARSRGAKSPVASNGSTTDARATARAFVDPVIGKQIGGATIVGFVGEGGMGRVYLGELADPARRVAVKLLSRGFDNPEAVGRFQREAAILDRLRHPGIAEIFGHGVWDDGSGGMPYMLIELVEEARTLADFANEKRLDRRARLELFHRVCEAIGFAHEMKVLHRDVKPANLLVDRFGRVKVIDFGVARAANGDLGVAGVRTETGQLIGTVQYMSPEQIAGDPRAIDLGTDVYALGVILYEMLLDAFPYDVRGLPLHEAARIVSEAAIELPSRLDSSIDPALEGIIIRCLERDRTRRYGNAMEVAEVLDRYLAGPGGAIGTKAADAEAMAPSASDRGAGSRAHHQSLAASDDDALLVDLDAAPPSRTKSGRVGSSNNHRSTTAARTRPNHRNSVAACGAGGGSARRGWAVVAAVAIVAAAAGVVASGVVDIKRVRSWIPGSLGGTASPAGAAAAELVAPIVEPTVRSTETLAVVSAPEGASVTIDGHAQGRTPLSLMITWTADTPRKTIEVAAPGFEGAAAIVMPDPSGRRAEPLRLIFNLTPRAGSADATLDRLLPIIIEGGAVDVRIDDGAPIRLAPGRREVPLVLARATEGWVAKRVTFVAPGHRIDAFGRQGVDTLTVEITASSIGDQPQIVRLTPS